MCATGAEKGNCMGNVGLRAGLIRYMGQRQGFIITAVALGSHLIRTACNEFNIHEINGIV